MYTVEEREALRSDLVNAARSDARISGAALTGSAAVGAEDEWSDIDLAFGIDGASTLHDALSDWTARMYERHGALHHVDVVAGAAIYRVFLLRSTLQVDLAFAPKAEFGARAPTFRLLFGEAARLRQVLPPGAEALIGMAWLYALHARSCLARGRWWQAEYMISGVRDQAMALACLRHGLPAVQGRGLDQLPADSLARFEEALIVSMEPAALARALRAAIAGLLHEIWTVDAELGSRLEDALRELAACVEPPAAQESPPSSGC